VQAVAVVFVRLHPVGTHGLEAELLAVDLVADTKDIVAPVRVEGWSDFEVFLEAFAEAESIK